MSTSRKKGGGGGWKNPPTPPKETEEDRERELRFDKWQFDPDFGRRRAGTLMNNALPAEFYNKGLLEELDYEEALSKISLLNKVRGIVENIDG